MTFSARAVAVLCAAVLGVPLLTFPAMAQSAARNGASAPSRGDFAPPMQRPNGPRPVETGAAAPQRGPGAGVSQTSDAPSVVAVVTARGRAHFQIGDGAPQPVSAGMVLEEGARLLTGPDGSMVVQIGSTQTITLDRLTSMSVDEVRRSAAGVERTRLWLDFGRVRLDVDSTRVANDVQVRTTDSVLSVEGTTLVMEATPGFPTMAYGIHDNRGRFRVEYANGILARVSGNQSTDARSPTPAQTSEQVTRVDTFTEPARELDERTVAVRSVGSSAEPLKLGLQIEPSSRTPTAAIDNPFTLREIVVEAVINAPSRFGVEAVDVSMIEVVNLRQCSKNGKEDKGKNGVPLDPIQIPVGCPAE